MKNIIKKTSGWLLAGCLFCSTSVLAQQETTAAWDFNATIIEACSCPMFCQCFFSTQPAEHHGGEHAGNHGAAAEHYCRFNNAFKVNEGTYNGVPLNDAKFWLSGDLGEDFSQFETKWAKLTFDPSVTPEQREGIKEILGNVYPFKWESFSVAEDATMQWEATQDMATASLDDGKVAEVVLNRQAGMTDEPVVIHNLRYAMAPRNDGLILMPNAVEAYRAGDDAFEFKGTTGFMVTIDMSSEDLKESH